MSSDDSASLSDVSLDLDVEALAEITQEVPDISFPVNEAISLSVASCFSDSSLPKDENSDTHPQFSASGFENQFNITLRASDTDEQLLQLSSNLKEVYSQTIKEEIRCKIQLKRIKLGEEELKVDVTLPSTTISYDDIVKRNETREKNRLFAKQSRERARAWRQELKETNYTLEVRKYNLLQRVQYLRKNLQLFKNFITRHRRECPFDEEPNVLASTSHLQE